MGIASLCFDKRFLQPPRNASGRLVTMIWVFGSHRGGRGGGVLPNMNKTKVQWGNTHLKATIRAAVSPANMTFHQIPGTFFHTDVSLMVKQASTAERNPCSWSSSEAIGLFMETSRFPWFPRNSFQLPTFLLGSPGIITDFKF